MYHLHIFLIVSWENPRKNHRLSTTVFQGLSSNIHHYQPDMPVPDHRQSDSDTTVPCMRKPCLIFGNEMPRHTLLRKMSAYGSFCFLLPLKRAWCRIRIHPNTWNGNLKASSAAVLSSGSDGADWNKGLWSSATYADVILELYSDNVIIISFNIGDIRKRI